VRFWDDFYEEETEPFEWYHPYAMIRGIIRRFAAEDDMIIQLGCGNSRLCEDMVNDGYKNVMNIDFSRVVVEQVVLCFPTRIFYVDLLLRPAPPLIHARRDLRSCFSSFGFWRPFASDDCKVRSLGYVGRRVRICAARHFGHDSCRSHRAQ